MNVVQFPVGNSSLHLDFVEKKVIMSKKIYIYIILNDVQLVKRKSKK